MRCRTCHSKWVDEDYQETFIDNDNEKAWRAWIYCNDCGDQYYAIMDETGCIIKRIEEMEE